MTIWLANWTRWKWSTAINASGSDARIPDAYGALGSITTTAIPARNAGTHLTDAMRSAADTFRHALNSVASVPVTGAARGRSLLVFITRTVSPPSQSDERRDRASEIRSPVWASVTNGIGPGIRLGHLRQGRPVPSETNFLVPIALKPMDTSMPKELGNHFAMVMLPMPLGISEVDALLGEVRTRMTRIKNSAEAMLVFGVQRVIAETPTMIAQNLTQFVANKSIGLLTNAPGPRAPIYLAGTRVEGMLGWVPTSSDQSIGLCIFSYNGHVSIGIATDAGIIPDPDRLEDLIQSGFADMVAAS